MSAHFRGRKEPKNLSHLIQLSHMRHGPALKALAGPTPTSWDSRTHGWIGDVKDQAQCGSCWDFSGTGVCEVAYNKAGVGGGARDFILSEEYTLDCGQNGGCNGDDNTTVLAWAKSTGLPLASAYGPYTAGGGNAAACRYKNGMTLHKISDWGFANSSGGQGVTPTADIKTAIMNYGCVGAGIAADDAFEAWGDPQNNPSMSKPFTGSKSKTVDHDIVLVGWMDDSSPHGGYWILRNSWGPGWGVAGYMAIEFGVNLVGAESVFAVLNAAASA